nr:ribonuclease H-like domain-containing protein [Tanacetum cinerariifolium]
MPFRVSPLQKEPTSLEEASTAGDAGEFALMGVTSEVHNCPFGCDNKYNELQKQYNELNEQNSEYFIQVQAYKNSLKTLEKQKRVLQRNQLTLKDNIRVLSIELENTSNLLKHSERINADVETAKKELQIKLDNHFGNELGWDDSAFSVFTTNSKDVEGRPLFNRFSKTDSMKAVPPPLSGEYTSLSDHIDMDESDESSEVNTNDFASSDSSVKSLKAKPNDSTSCALTSSVSTSENEAESESNVRTPIQEPIIVQDLPNFSCNSSDKNENTFMTSCNKNGYFNKKAGVLLKTGKVNIPPARPQPVPTGKTKAFAPVPTGRQNRPFPVPTNRGYSPSVITGIDGQLQLSPQQVVFGNHIKKENPFLDAEDERVFDSGSSRSMTGNKERLDDFQAFQGEKVTFEGGEGRITGKGTIRTLTLDFENVYYVKELQHFNLFSISQICDKKNRVLFTDTECLVLSKDFKLPDESMVVLRVPRKDNIYTINLNNLCPGVKGNLARGLPPKLFKNDHTCVACCKVRTACYVLNRVLVTSPHNKTPYALLTGNIPSVSHFKPFGCHVTILNTSDHLGKFDGKADEAYILDILQGLGHEWYFDLDYLTGTLGYKHVQANQSAGTQDATTNPADLTIVFPLRKRLYIRDCRRL